MALCNMITLSKLEATLPLGYRFNPTDDELICGYLEWKMKNISSHEHRPLVKIPELDDLNKNEPWNIPLAGVEGKWYFFCKGEQKYTSGGQINRVGGFWKQSGNDMEVRSKEGNVVGMRKSLVFYTGESPKGQITEWVMHQFRLQRSSAPPNTSSLKEDWEDWVLCSVFKTSRKRNIHGDTSSPSLPLYRMLAKL